MYISTPTDDRTGPDTRPTRVLPPLIAKRFGGVIGRQNVVEALSRQRLFAKVPEAIEVVADVAEIEHYSMGELLIEQGASDADLFLVLSGQLGVLVGRDFVGERLPGDYVGEMAAIDVGQKRSARVVATEDSVVARLPDHEFRRILRCFPLIYEPITLTLATRLRARETFHRVRNPRPVVFLGSSMEQCVVVDALHDGLKVFNHDPRHWRRDRAFLPSSYVLEGLDALARTADMAVFVLHPDDLTVTRKRRRPVPRDNIVFEFGLFVGALGRPRTIGLRPRGVDVSLPSDLFGLTFIEYGPPEPGIAFDAAALCTEINELSRGLCALRK